MIVEDLRITTLHSTLVHSTTLLHMATLFCCSMYKQKHSLFLLVVNPSVRGSDCPSLYRAEMATEYSVKDIKLLRS